MSAEAAWVVGRVVADKCCVRAATSSRRSPQPAIRPTPHRARIMPRDHFALGQCEDIQRPSLHGDLWEVLHRVDEAERGGGVAGVESAGDDRAGPAADAGEDRDVLLAVGPLVGDRLADDAGAALEFPKLL